MKFLLNIEHRYHMHGNIPSGTFHEVSPKYETSLPYAWRQSLLKNIITTCVWAWSAAQSFLEYQNMCTATFLWNISQSFTWMQKIITMQHFMKFHLNIEHHYQMHEISLFTALLRTSLPNAWKLSLYNTSWSFTWKQYTITTCTRADTLFSKSFNWKKNAIRTPCMRALHSFLKI